MKKKVLLAAIAFLLVILLCVLCFIYYKNNISNWKFNSSKQHMLVIEQSRAEGKTLFYCVFNQKEICEACFCEMENPSEKMHIDEDLQSGYINPNVKDNILYTEYTGLRGYSVEEIKNMFKNENEKIIKDW